MYLKNTTMALLWCFLLVSTAGATSSEEDGLCSIESVVGLVSAVRRHLQSASIILLDSHYNLEHRFPLIIKAASATNLPTTLMSMQSISWINKTVQTVNDKTLYVILSGDEIMKNYLRKILEASEKQRVTWLWLLHQVALDEFFDGVAIPFSSELLVARASRTKVRLSRVSRVTADRPLVAERYGMWTPGARQLRLGRNVDRHKTDFQGVTIKTAVLDVKEITQLATVGNKTTVVGGYFGEVWQLLEKELNFTSEYVWVEGQSVGSLTAHGNWTGMMALMVDGSVEVGLTRTYVTARRKQVIDFTRPLIFTTQNIFIKMPEYNNVFTWNKYFLPFCRVLWMAIGLVVLGVSAILSLMYWLAYNYGIDGHDGQNLLGFSDALFNMFGVFCSQGSGTSLASSSCRLVVVSASCTAMIVLAAYSGSVISQLTLMDARLPFTDLKGLASHGLYRLGVVRNSGLVDLFNNKANPELYEVYTKVMKPIKNNFPHSVTHGLNKVCKDKNFAFMADLDVAMSYMKHLSCNLVVLPDFSIMSSMSVLIAMNSPYKDAIDYSLVKMQDAGILHRLYYKYFPREMPTAGSSQQSVGFFVVLPILLLMCAGISISTVFLFSEIVTFKIITMVKL